MRLPPYFAIVCLLGSGLAHASCREPPPPDGSEEPPPDCQPITVGYLKSCPTTTIVERPACGATPIAPQLVCDPVSATSARCELYPLAYEAGYLSYRIDVTAGGTMTSYGTDDVTFACAANQVVTVNGWIENLGVETMQQVEFYCGQAPAQPAAPASVGVSCSGLSGYNTINIAPPEGGPVTHYLVDLKSVNYYHFGWQRAYSGPNANPLVQVPNESYVRAAACNSMGCSPSVESATRASPSLSCP